MDGYDCDPDDGEPELNNLADVFDSALDGNIIFFGFKLLALCLWGGAFDICWNPANWL